MDDLKPIIDSFAGLALAPVQRVEEHLFVRRYLPLFLTREESTPVTAWLEVAKHPYSPVEVIKGGKVLFVVPPLCRQVTLKSDGLRDSVYEILELGRKKEMISPVMGANYLRTELDRIIRREPANLETIEQWNIIFAYYGLPLVELPKTDIVETPTTPLPNISATGFEDF